MDAVRSSPVRYRVPGAVPVAGSSPAGGHDSLERPLPVAAAILWTPTATQAPADLDYPVFVTQRALAAAHSHAASQPDGASALGFLVGNAFLAPGTRVPYLVVESTVPISWSISGDHLKPALVQGRAIVQEEVQRSGGQLVGWYHSHAAPEARLSDADVAAHLACFDQPWQIALVLARGAGVTGGVFRVVPGAAWSNECLPFYELLDHESLLPDGRKISDLAWANYRTHAAVIASDRVSHAAPEPQPRVLFPDEPEAGTETLPAPVRRLPLAPVARLAGFGALGMLAAGALFGVFRALSRSGSDAGGGGPGGPAAAAAVQAAAVMAPERIDRYADTVAFAIAAFDLRVRLFDARKMACPDLARGLVDLEERWTAYNTARRGEAATLDSARDARDRTLYSDVDAAERRFERSRCPRP
jgi:proteasome lid subunit RPN8/RPN11